MDEKKQLVEDQLAKGAKINEQDGSGRTALHLATDRATSKKEKLLLESLLEYGPDFNAKDESGDTAVKIALRNDDYEVLRMLLKRGAAFEKEDERLTSDKSCKELLKNGVFMQGPWLNTRKTLDLVSKVEKKKMSEECEQASQKFYSTITTFYLGSENETPKDIHKSNVGECERSESGGSTDEREYHFAEKTSVSDILSKRDKDTDTIGSKTWKWYHLPANNVSLASS